VNVILILIDTLRRDHLGPYGGPPTPGFERLAASGVTFDRYFLGSYPCMPARRDLWTGRFEFPWRGWGPLLPGDRDLPSALAAAGCTTMLVTDHYHLFQPGAGNYHHGFDGWEFIRGQEDDHWRSGPGPEPVSWPAPRETKLHRRWDRYWRNTAERRAGGRWRSTADTFAARTFAEAEAWLAAQAPGAPPFFLMVDCFDPHEPFDPPPELWPAAVGGTAIPWPIYGRADRYSPEELEGIRALYAAEVALVDACLLRFVEACERLGRMSDTLLLVTTDHGHLFGEHGMVGKPSSVHGDSNLYRPLAHVPLFAAAPGGVRGARCGALAQTVDLFPTVLEAMGVPCPEGPAGPVHGRSLLPQAAGGDGAGPLRNVACYGKFGEAVQITDGELVLHRWPAGPSNAPLHWYGAEAPAFLRPRGLGAPEPWPGPAVVRYPVDWERGPCATVLLDDGEDGDLSARRPADRARLESALRDWLRALGAPPEQAARLGL
jgi:arylsulfatase A-like enzyme